MNCIAYIAFVPLQYHIFSYIDSFVLYHYVCDHLYSMSILFVYFVSFCYLNFSHMLDILTKTLTQDYLIKHNTLQRSSNYMKYDTYIIVRY